VRDAGFTGRLYAVNRAFGEDRQEIDGVPAHRSVRDIDGPVDLAVVAVPAEHVPEVVAECGEHGVQGLVVISAGYAESGPEGRERQRALVRQARAYGMRIIGPNAFGIVNTSPDVRLNASLAPEMPRPGRIGLFAQSGAIGIALLSRLHRRGGGVTGVTGVSTFVSAGNRADVSGNDVLQYWYDDPDTDVALMYLETIGNPRKFTRLARRTAAVKPLVVVQGGAPLGHAVRATRLPHATVSALLRQAGVIRVDTITELVDTGLLLARQPLPQGPRVAILGNSESLGVLTYDRCLAEGLRPQQPQDLTTAASAEDFRAALARALADDATDAVVVTAIPAVGEGAAEDAALAEALRSAAEAVPGKPVLVVHVELGGLAEALSAAASTGPAAGTGPVSGTAPHAGAVPYVGTVAGGSAAGSTSAVAEPGTAPAPPPPAVPGAASVPGRSPSGPAPYPRTAPEARHRPGAAPGLPPGPTPGPGPRPGTRLIPAYPAAERAVRALAEAVRYGQWRRDAADPGKVPEYDDIDEKGAAALIDRLLAHGQALTLGADETCELLGRYGVHVQRALAAPTPDAAAEAARALGYPVALKATAPHLRHRADLGGVRLDLADEEQLRRTYAELTELFGKPEELRPVVQAMVPRGVDTVVRAVIDPAAGAVLSFGLAGAPSQLLDDMAHRLVPVTDREATSMIRSIRTAPLLFGWRGSAPVDTLALEELLLRVSRLVDDHPEVVAITLEPVVVAPRGVSVLGAGVRLAPPPARDDLGPRTLPAY
jgi:acyl-CoA synthetase (NDP forming)